jgi:carbamate kinase
MVKKPASRKPAKKKVKKAVRKIKARPKAVKKVKPKIRKAVKKAKKMTAVIAFGGNALVKPGQTGTFEEQMANISEAVGDVVKLVRKGWKVLITHGNGPQVGNLLIQQEEGKVPRMPLYVCVAETQAQIGFMFQEAFYNKLRKLEKHIPVATVVTQVMVDPKDKAFKHPSKPVGPFYNTEKGLPVEWHLAKTFRGWRRVVASPEPKYIVEADVIKELSRDSIVIACGGGGVPVIKMKGSLKGMSAVIDKDLTAQLLAEEMDADYLIILTDVDQVALNYKMKEQEWVKRMTLKEARQYLKEGHFHVGSMRPKIIAAMRFLEGRPKRKVIITSFGLLSKALNGRAGTVIQ